MKILIISDQAGSGKDFMAEILRDELGADYKNTSLMIAKSFMFDTLKEEFGYKDYQECYDRRSEPGVRKIWYNLINSYNAVDKTRLVREVLKENDFYIGLRNPEQIIACDEANLFDLKIFVDAGGRVVRESYGSNKVDSSYADVIINNAYSKSLFVDNVIRFGKVLKL